EAFQVIERIAIQQSAPMVVVGKDFQYRLNSSSLEGQDMSVWNTSRGKTEQGLESIDLHIPLLGRHQIENAATAYAVLHTINENGLPVNLPAIKQGFATVIWPGRFEVLQRQPVVVVDSAHNQDSAQRLKVALQDYFPGKSTILVFGASEDKDIRGMLGELLPNARLMILTRSFHPRAADPRELLRIAEEFDCPAVVESSVESALRRALQQVDNESIVLVTGSIFMAAEARHSWYNQIGLTK
ncbi:MAG TPA: cyanophycin synthetase, partial [Anaerolineales bacterium]|nr:cyanophycin synthetase [Anaerolineales bacterium]